MLTKKLREQYRQLRSLGTHDAFALLACITNGEPGAAICRLEVAGQEYKLTPWFVSVTPGMVVLDEKGRDVKEPGQSDSSTDLNMLHAEPIAPRLNLNGTSKTMLMADHLNCLDTLRIARQALNTLAPHGRDYQTAPSGTWQAAIVQHRERMDVLMKLENEITRIAEDIFDQNTGRG